MTRGLSLALLTLAAVARAQAPDENEQNRMLDEGRRAAINYTKRLPDFLCTEVIHRFEASGSAAPFRPIDILTVQVSYFQMHESYTLQAVNNRPTKRKMDSVGGATSQGEFGSNLLLIFHPGSKARFAFKEWSAIGERRVGVFTYTVERANSHFELRIGTGGVVAGYHGEVSIDPVSHMVLRIEEAIDIPEYFPVQYSRSTGDYNFVDVGGQQYLLPVRWETWAADLPSGRHQMTGRDIGRNMTDQKRYHNLIEFKDYRKYAAESKLTFDAPEDPVKKK